MNYYEELGPLVIGSRFRKLSERILNEITEVYKTKGIDFEAGWFHILYLLNKNTEMSITEVSETLQVAHPSVIQVAKVMEKNDVVRTFQSEQDKRKRMLCLTDKGRELLKELIPIWNNIQDTIGQILNEGEYSEKLMLAMDELEENLDKKSLAERM